MAAPDADVVDVLQETTRVLVGVASRALERLPNTVPLSQFRLLMALDEMGSSPSAAAAHRLGTAASTVTRLADRLEASGHLTRHRGRPNRSVVVLELTAAGRALVGEVVLARRAELAAIVSRLPAAERDALAVALAVLCRLAAETGGLDAPDPALLPA